MCKATLFPEPDNPLRMRIRTPYGYPPNGVAASEIKLKPDGVRGCAGKCPGNAHPVGLAGIASLWVFAAAPSWPLTLDQCVRRALRGVSRPHDDRKFSLFAFSGSDQAVRPAVRG